jgi:hypothetical protein
LFEQPDICQRGLLRIIDIRPQPGGDWATAGGVLFRNEPSAADPETFPATDHWASMTDEPDSLRTRLGRLEELAEQAFDR